MYMITDMVSERYSHVDAPNFVNRQVGVSVLLPHALKVFDSDHDDVFG